MDCVRQGHPEYLYGLVEAAGLVIERDVANWIANQGGWVSYIFLFLSGLFVSHLCKLYRYLFNLVLLLSFVFLCYLKSG